MFIAIDQFNGMIAPTKTFTAGSTMCCRYASLAGSNGIVCAAAVNFSAVFTRQRFLDVG